MDNNIPLLSIIAPVRNEANYIFELINSFSKIKDPRLELLVSDNHSDDGTYEILMNNTVSNVKVVRPKTRLSPFNNHIYAINHSSGKYIFPVGGDDYVSSECIELILKVIRPGVIIVPKLRSFNDATGKTIEITNLKKDVTRFFSNDKFSVLRYLQFINYDQLVFVVCEKKMLSHLEFIKPNTIETFASWSNIFVLSRVMLKDIIFLDSVLMHKRYNKKIASSGFAEDQYGNDSLFIKSFNSIYNTYAYLRKTGEVFQAFYLLFFNRYSVGNYNNKNPDQQVRKLLVFAPTFMIFLSPFLAIKRKLKR
jgi:glycosyltransferase involved in cell wall biosynthesis